MQNEITDLSRITAELDPTGAIETYIWDEIMDCKWSDIESIVSQLETAPCSAGSWSGMICTSARRRYGVAVKGWVEDIEQAVAEYEDATGEAPNFDPYDSGFSLSAVLTFAVDWVAHRIASRIRAMDKPVVVTVASDSMDPFPERIAFPSEWEAQDWVSEQIQSRMDYRVQHSQYAISEEELQQLEEEESALIKIDVEKL